MQEELLIVGDFNIHIDSSNNESLNFRNYTSIPRVKIDNFPIHFYVILLTFALSLETKMYCARKHFVSSSAMLMLYTIGSMGSLIHTSTTNYSYRHTKLMTYKLITQSLYSQIA